MSENRKTVAFGKTVGLNGHSTQRKSIIALSSQRQLEQVEKKFSQTIIGTNMNDGNEEPLEIN
jgi:hypothetical protein